MAISYLEKKDNKLIFTGEYMEAYVLDKLFKKNLNEVVGEDVDLFGLFNYRVSNKKGEIDPKSKLYTFNFPSKIVTKPTSIETAELELLPGCGVQKYRVLKYYNGDAMMECLQVVKSITNVETLVNMFLSASIPNTIPYEKLPEVFMTGLFINGETGNVNASTISVYISELNRYKKDTSIPFRKIAGKGNCSSYDYVPANVRSVCANNSTFSALTFEDIDTMMVYSINKKRYNKPQNASPIEQIIQV